MQEPRRSEVREEVLRGVDEAILNPQDGPGYWQHRLKHIACGLHFVVCSDYEGWPQEGTTREQQMGEATGIITCPECGGTDGFLHWKQRVPGFIFMAVPGDAQGMSVHGNLKPKPAQPNGAMDDRD